MRANLQQARRDKGLTQKTVANYLGISYSAYQHIEYGRRGTNEKNWLRLFSLFEKKIPLDKLMECDSSCHSGTKASQTKSPATGTA